MTVQSSMPPPVYRSLIEFMDGFFFPTLRRSDQRVWAWCPEWWRHPDAVQRLHVVWRTWEEAQTSSPADWSNWWLYHLDPHLAALTEPSRGPFRDCNKGHVSEGEPFPSVPPAPGVVLPGWGDLPLAAN
jgi:hypothetical protein